jgi:class 3 adenylate cyclase/tetratricopeptide (TPR) repeat protein
MSTGTHPAQVQRYLPFKLYNELILNPGPESLGHCVEHLTALLQTVETYCSAPVLAEAQKPPHNVQGQWLEATLLFADISGFTAMSERLNARGRAGAEEITRIVNAYFAVMVDVLRQNGGALIKFGGDALLGLFAGLPQDTSRCAVQAALDMQQTMAQFAEIETSVGCFELQMKVGLHTGRVFAAHVGTASRMEYWVAGDDVNHTALAEEAAESGQVVVSAAIQQHLGDWVVSEPLPDHPDFYSVSIAQVRRLEPQPPPREMALAHDISELTRRLDTLVPYLPAGLLPRLVHNPRSRRVEGEHRLVAVLFVNVTSFSELAATLPSDQDQCLTETMQDYFATMQSIVEGHGGTINKTDLYSKGDKLLAIFGAPVAHEDDVDQAARAAVTMQARMDGVNQRLVARCPTADVRLRQRIGLSTGHVFSGNVGATIRQEYTIMGDEVNLAARLMSAAEWDEVWVTSNVFIWLESFGRFTPVGEFSVKGKQRPISVYRIEEMEETYRPKPSFVDRNEARTVLQDHVEQLLQGQGHIVSITGEPGVGKSRLWDELQSIPEAKDVLWLVGHCREQGVTYHLMADLVRDYLELDAADDPNAQLQVLVHKVEDLFGPDEVREKCPFLGILLGLPIADEWKERVDFLGEHLPARVVEEMVGLFDRLTQDRPLVLICEDLHWVDDSSVDVLLKMVELVEYAPIILGFTLRPGRHAGCEQIFGKVAVQLHQWYRPISLQTLDVEYSTQIVNDVLGEAATPEIEERILKRSRGNPLFIGEMARAAMIAPDISIPGRVHKIIEGRVDAMTVGPRRALQAAAVAGAQFTLPELVYVLEELERDVRRHLAESRRMQLVESKGNYYEFTHSLVHEVVYTRQDHQIRRAFHRRLGMYWAEQDNAPKAAHHYFAGELWDRALEQGERAGDQRREAYAHAEAIRLYQQALKAAKELDDLAAQGRLYGWLGQVYYRSGNYEQAIQAHQQELCLLLDQSTNALAQAEAHCAMGRVYDRWGQYNQALDELERGLKLAGPDHNVTRARLLLTRCSVLTNTGKLAEAEQDGLQALQIAQAVGARPEEAYACNNLGAAYGTQGEYEHALGFHQRSLSIRRELDVAYEVEMALGNVATALSFLGRIDKAEPYYQEALEIQKRIGDRHGEGHSWHNLAWLYMDRGQPEAAEDAFLRALALWEGVDHRRGVAFIYNDLGTLYLTQERWEEAREHLQESAQRYEAMGANTFLPENYIALAQVYLGLDQPEDALAVAQEALDWAQRNKDRRQEAMAYCGLGEVYLIGGDPVEAARFAQTSLDMAQVEPVLPDQVRAAERLLEKIHRA